VPDPYFCGTTIRARRSLERLRSCSEISSDLHPDIGRPMFNAALGSRRPKALVLQQARSPQRWRHDIWTFF